MCSTVRCLKVTVDLCSLFSFLADILLVVSCFAFVEVYEKRLMGKRKISYVDF